MGPHCVFTDCVTFMENEGTVHSCRWMVRIRPLSWTANRWVEPGDCVPEFEVLCTTFVEFETGRTQEALVRGGFLRPELIQSSQISISNNEHRGRNSDIYPRRRTERAALDHRVFSALQQDLLWIWFAEWFSRNSYSLLCYFETAVVITRFLPLVRRQVDQKRKRIFSETTKMERKKKQVQENIAANHFASVANLERLAYLSHKQSRK